MSENSIFGEAGEKGRRDRPHPDKGAKRPNPSHGLFGTRLLPDGYKRSAPAGRD